LSFFYIYVIVTLVKNMEYYRQVEKSIIKKYRKELWSKFVKAIDDYNLIEENDNICVCISGGKDSFLLAKLMQELKRHNKFNFNVKYLVMDPGYNEENINKIKENAKKLNIDITLYKSNIFEVVHTSNGKSPCYLCARMRRGCLYAKAQELGCNKIALGHHFNDVIETLLLNMIYNGHFSGMLPILDSDNFENMKLIRPMYYIKEENIIKWAKSNDLTFLDCACSVTKKDIGKRKEIKELVANLVKMYKNSDINLFNSLKNVNLNTVAGYYKNNEYFSMNKNNDKEKM